MRILCATDLLPKSESALDRAGMLAERRNAKLLIVHAAGAEPPYLIDEELQRAAGHLSVRTTPPRWHYDLAPEIAVRAGPPLQVLLDVARQFEPTIVVLGASRRRFAQDALLGTIAERLVRRLDCPVLIVRCMPWRAYHRVLLLLERAGSEQIAAAAVRLTSHDHGNDMLSTGAPHEEMERSRPDLLVVGAGRSGWLRRMLFGDAVRRAMTTRGSDLLIVPKRRACAVPKQERPKRETTTWPLWFRGRRSTA